MPRSAKPRHKQTQRPRIRDISGDRPVMRVGAGLQPVTGHVKRNVRNAIVRFMANIEDGTATQQDIDEMGQAGALYERFVLNKYAPENPVLCAAYEAARKAALQRGQQLGKYGLNPSEIDTVKELIFEGLLPAIGTMHEGVFLQLDTENTQYLLTKGFEG